MRSSRRGARCRWGRGGLVAVAMLGAPVAQAQNAALTAADEAIERSVSSFRGSNLVYRNALALRSLSRDRELTHNPYYAMALSMLGQWWAADRVFTRARFSLTHEFTRSDIAHQTVPSDLRLGVGTFGRFRVPVLDVQVDPLVEVALPIHPLSRARTQVLEWGGGLGLLRRLPVGRGAVLSYRFHLSKFQNRYTTAARETPLVTGCGDDAAVCGEYTHSGVRNPSVRFRNTLLASWTFADRWSMYAFAQFFSDRLYGAAEDDRVSFRAQAPTSMRHFLATDVGVAWQAIPGITARSGITAVHNQLAPGGGRYTPILNRFSLVYFDLVFDLPTLWAPKEDNA